MPLFSYPRVLVKYRLTSGWSDYQWCDIRYDSDTKVIQTSVAPASEDTMPEDDKFQLLTEDQVKKLLVYDCSVEISNYYCLNISKDKMLRFDSSQQTKTWAHGRIWSFESNDFFTAIPAIPLAKVFSSEETKSDPRLWMRGGDDYLILTDNSSQGSLKSIYVSWKEASTRRNTIAVSATLKSLSPQVIEDTWLTTRKKMVEINIADQGDLSDLDLVLLSEPICNGLSAIKALSASQEDYSQALKSLLKTQCPISLTQELKSEVRLFHLAWLSGISKDLNDVFIQGQSKPLLTAVHAFIRKCIFNELKSVDANAQWSEYTSKCPGSFNGLCLGTEVKSTIILSGIEPDPDEDHRMALEAQIAEYSNYGPGLWSRAPSQANHSYSFLKALGIILCLVGGYVALTSFLLGMGLLAAGISCLLTQANNNLSAESLYLRV